MPLDFNFSEDEELFRKTVKEFVKKELAPKAKHWDEAHEFPWESIRKAAKLGLTGLTIPEEYGGQNADLITAGIAVEEISREDLSLSYAIYGLGIILSRMLSSKGNAALKEKWLPKICSGEAVLGLALTEPSCGSDAAAIKTTARREGDSLLLNGEKLFISFINDAKAFIVACKTEPAAGVKGISLVFVEMDSPGISTTPYGHMGFRCASFGGITFKDVEVPTSNIIGEMNKGFPLLMSEFDLSRPVVALMCIGAAEAAGEEAIAYAKERTAFGRPIAKYESVQFRVAEDYAKLEAAKLLAYKALWLKNQNLPCIREASTAKWLGTESSFHAINNAIQIFGGSGYTTDFLHEQRFRGVRGLMLAEGTSDIMLMVIARELFGSEYLSFK